MAFDMNTVPFIMAIMDKDGNWLSSGYDIGSSVDVSVIPARPGSFKDSADADVAYTQAATANFTRVRALKAKAERPYSGTGSNVGPAVSGRVDLADLFIEKYFDAMSPFLFDYCCTGDAFRIVDFVALKKDKLNNPFREVHIRITDTNVSSYQAIGGRFFGDTYGSGSGGMSVSTEISRRAFVAGASRKEEVTFWYTAISIYHETRKDDGTINTKVDRAWDGATDDPPAPKIIP